MCSSLIPFPPPPPPAPARRLRSTGDNPPGFGAGHVPALAGRYAVTYRLVNTVYCMVVAPPGANVFLCMQLLDAAAKVLVGVSKGVDVTPDKVAKRYTEVGCGRHGMGWLLGRSCEARTGPHCLPPHASPHPPHPPPTPQVYMLLEDLLSTGLSTLPPAFMHSSATSERLLVLPASAADAARRFKRMVRGGRPSSFVPKKEGEEDGAADPTPPPVPETPSSRGGQAFSAAHADPLGAVAFDIPPDALPPPPARAAVARRPVVLAAPLRPHTAAARIQGGGG